MLSSLSNKKLGIVFAVLAIVVLLFFVTDLDKNDKTFRNSLVEIDSAAVTAIKIYPKTKDHGEVSLMKEGEGWIVLLKDGKKAKVTDQKIGGLIDQIESIVPKRLASRSKDKWADMQVDSSGTRIVIYEGSDDVLDIVLGRFSFKQPRSMSTFVRLSSDDDVYEVDGFLDMTFNQPANSFRDDVVISDDFNTWSRLSFSYPADSSFTMNKQGDYWYLNNTKPDSSTAANALRQLGRITSNNFMEGIEPKDLGMPTHKLTIDSEKLGEIVVEGYYFAEEKIMVHSSLNPEAVFDGTKNSLFSKVFVGKGKFEKKQ